MLNFYVDWFCSFYRAMPRIARTMLSQDVCPSILPSICPSVCLSHAGILSKGFNVSSNFVHHRVWAHHSSFCSIKLCADIPTETSLTRALNAGGKAAQRCRAMLRVIDWLIFNRTRIKCTCKNYNEVNNQQCKRNTMREQIQNMHIN